MPKRYIVKCEWGYEHDTIEDDEGRFVLWEDYKELLAEIESMINDEAVFGAHNLIPSYKAEIGSLRSENERLKGEVEQLSEVLSSIEHGRAQIPDSSTIFMNGKVPLVWKILNKYDMQDVARRALLEIHPPNG